MIMTRNKIVKAVLSITAVGALAVGGVACEEAVQETGKDKGNESVEGGEADPAEPESLFADGKKDVKIKSCNTTDWYGAGAEVVIADLVVTNSSSKVSDYLITVEVTDAKGDRLDTLMASASRVAPGQVVDTGDSGAGLESIGEEDAEGTKAVTGEFKCSVDSADRTATVE